MVEKRGDTSTVGPDPVIASISTFFVYYPSGFETNITKNMPFITILAPKFAYVNLFP